MKPSDAWLEFVAELRLTVQLLKVEPELVRSTGRATTDASIARVRGSVLLISGHLQGCVEAQIEEFLEAIDGREVPAGAIPESIRGNLAQRYFGRRDKPTPADVATAHRRYAPLWHDEAPIPSGTIKTASIPDEIWNPWPDKIRTMVKRCDVDVYEVFGSAYGPQELANAKARLEELVRFRNDVAHGSTPFSWTPGDVRLRLRSAVRFARAVDSGLGDQLTAITGRGWK